MEQMAGIYLMKHLLLCILNIIKAHPSTSYFKRLYVSATHEPDKSHQSRNSPPFVEPACSSPCSQEPATGPILSQTNPVHLFPPYFSNIRSTRFPLPKSLQRSHPIPKPCVIFRNKLIFYGVGLLAPLPTPSWRTIPYRLSATAYSIYSQLPS